MPTRIRNFLWFSANIFFSNTKIIASAPSLLESCLAVYPHPIVSGNLSDLLECPVLLPARILIIIAILASFLPRHSYCKVFGVEACSLPLEKNV